MICDWGGGGGVWGGVGAVRAVVVVRVGLVRVGDVGTCWQPWEVRRVGVEGRESGSWESR